jgi:2-hydroxychromene-2-carboxylate isomerase
MTKTIEFLFDVGSPTAYLAWTQLPSLAKRTGAEITLTPILLGGLFTGSGNHSPADVPAKRAYIATDCARYAAQYGVPFHLNPHFPVNTLMAMRAIAGAQLEGAMDDVAAAAFEAMWIDGMDLGDPTALEAFADKAGVSIDRFAGWISSDTAKAHLRANTDHAVERGAFGAPTFFAGGDMFFGQDRMDWVEAAVA